MTTITIHPDLTRDEAIILLQVERTENEMLRIELRAAQRSIEARDRTIKLLDSEIEAIGAGGVTRLMGDSGPGYMQIAFAQMKAIATKDAEIARLREALSRQVANIESWQKTGIPAGPEESKSIYEQLKVALAQEQS